MKIAGIIIMTLGLGLIIFTTIGYFSSDKIAQIANIEIMSSSDFYIGYFCYFITAKVTDGCKDNQSEA